MDLTTFRRDVFKIFTRKYNLTVKAEVIGYLAEKCAEGNPGRQDVLADLEMIAQSYIKQDDYSVIVTAPALEALLRVLQIDANSGPSTSTSRKQAPSSSLLLLDEGDYDPDLFFNVIDAFKMPRWHYATERRRYEKIEEPGSLNGSPASKAMLFRSRYHTIRQRIMRNEHFTPSSTSDQTPYHRLTAIKNMLGHYGDSFLLFGMLTTGDDGTWYLEDLDDRIKLDIRGANHGHGLFTEGSYILVDGTFETNGHFTVTEIGQPPNEKRAATRQNLGHIDFLGLGPNHFSPKDEIALLRAEKALDNVNMVILSDLWLDQPGTLESLDVILTTYAAQANQPYAFVIMGDFMREPFQWTSQSITKYTTLMSDLGDEIARFPSLALHSHWIFVPGPGDPSLSSPITLPRAHIPPIFTQRIRTKVKHVHFASNPCRLRYFGQEIVVSRDNLASRMLRNCLQAPKSGWALKADEAALEAKAIGSSSEEIAIARTKVMTRNLVKTLLDQGNLSPLPLATRPVYWEFDQALRLHPLPTVLVLADSCPAFEHRYEDCLAINPSGFASRSKEYNWQVYYPATRTCEASSFPKSNGLG